MLGVSPGLLCLKNPVEWNEVHKHNAVTLAYLPIILLFT